MINEIMRALGLIAVGALLVLFCAVERDNRDDDAWFDADWEQTEEHDL